VSSRHSVNGHFQTPPEETRAAVEAALASGYRHIDAAAAYGNERQVGEAVSSSGLDRSEVFLETKIWISDYGYDQTLHGFEKIARKLGVDQIDLLILHQALPSDFDATRQAYRALESLPADGEVRAIGVSNLMVDHLTALLECAKVVPAVNQIEVHPYFTRLRAHRRRARGDRWPRHWSTRRSRAVGHHPGGLRQADSRGLADRRNERARFARLIPSTTVRASRHRIPIPAHGSSSWPAARR
jgi:hypothetical protein